MVDFKNVNSEFDENLKKYENREINVLTDCSIRRYTVNGNDLAEVYYKNYQKPVHSGWQTKQKIKKEPIAVSSVDEIRTERSKNTEIEKERKGTGGKEAYVLIATNQEGIISGLSDVSQRMLLNLFYNGIQWNTGKLVQNRSKTPHTSVTLAKMVKSSERTIKAALKELSDKDIIHYFKDKKAYYINTKIAKKGAVVKNENEIRERDDSRIYRESFC